VERCLRLSSGPFPDPVEVTRLNLFIKLYIQPGPKPLQHGDSRPGHESTPKEQTQESHHPPYPSDLPEKFRRRPYLIVANGFPYLRWAGSRHSPLLGAILKSKIRQRQSRQDRLDVLQDDLAYAKTEDVFDHHITKVASSIGKKKSDILDGEQWKTAAQEAVDELNRQLLMQEADNWNRTGEILAFVRGRKEEKKLVLKDLRQKRKEVKKAEDEVGQKRGAVSFADFSG